jgi:hypothetical protein
LHRFYGCRIWRFIPYDETTDQLPDNLYGWSVRVRGNRHEFSMYFGSILIDICVALAMVISSLG